MSTQSLQIDVMQYLMPKYQVRKLRPDETIPECMDAGFEKFGQLDREWCWVYESCGSIKGVLLASPCHGTAFLWRFKVLPECGELAALKLLKRFRRDALDMGVYGFLTLIDLSTVTGKRLKRVVERCGGKDYGAVNLLSSPLPLERK